MAISQKPENSAEATTSRRAFAAVLAAGFLLGAVPVFLGPLNFDAGWLLLAARRVLDGDRLYIDVVETNPPLVVWLHMAPVMLERLAGIPEVLAFRGLMLLAVAVSILCSAGILRRILPGMPVGRFAILLSALGVLLPISGYDFGEREHLLVAMTLPYLLMAAGRGSGVVFGGGSPWIVGLMAGLVIALKPYFAPLWLGIEGYLALRSSGWRDWVRPENLSVMAVGVVYGVAALILSPEYLDLVRWARPLYAACGSAGITEMADHPAVMTSIVAALCYAIVRPRDACLEIARVLMIADLALLSSLVLQHKGYSYHYYPPLAVSILALTVLFVDSRSPIPGRSRCGGVIAGGIALAMIILSLGDRVVDCRLWQGDPTRSNTYHGRLARLVREQAAGGGFFVFSPAVVDAFPMVNEVGANWASRHPCLWFLAGLYHGPTLSTPPESYRSIPAMGAAERFLFDTVVEDLLRDRPELLLVDEGPRRGVYCVQPFDYLAYYGRDPRFAALFREYEPMPRLGDFRPYRRRVGASRGDLTIRQASRGR